MKTMGLLFLALGASHALAGDVAPGAQAARGQAMFFDQKAAVQCGSCHSLAGKGTAIGPDLSRLARLSPPAIAKAIRATLTEYVQTVKLKKGGEFPGMPDAKEAGSYYDLSANPPVLRKLDPSEIVSQKENGTWKHPPSSAGFTSEQLADLISYIKWASYGDTKGVNPEEIQ